MRITNNTTEDGPIRGTSRIHCPVSQATGGTRADGRPQQGPIRDLVTGAFLCLGPLSCREESKQCSAFGRRRPQLRWGVGPGSSGHSLPVLPQSCPDVVTAAGLSPQPWRLMTNHCFLKLPPRRVRTLFRNVLKAFHILDYTCELHEVHPPLGPNHQLHSLQTQDFPQTDCLPSIQRPSCYVTKRCP